MLNVSISYLETLTAKPAVGKTSCVSVQRHIVVDTFFGYDEESMDSESSSVASFRMDRTPATPDEDMANVRPCVHKLM